MNSDPHESLIVGPCMAICKSKRKIKKTTKLTNTYDYSNDSTLFPLLKVENQRILPPK